MMRFQKSSLHDGPYIHVEENITSRVNAFQMAAVSSAELFNNRDFGLPSRQNKKDRVFLMAVQASFPKELDFLSIPRPDCLPRNAHSFYNP